MRTLKALLPALVLGAVTLAFVGVAAALVVDDPGTPEEPTPTEVPDCTTTTTDGAAEAESTLPDGEDECGDASTDTDLDGDDGIVDEVETPDETVPEVSAPEEQPANHGAAVSEAAHSCPPGPAHGPCVSEVARGDAGKPGQEGAYEDQDEADEPAPAGGGGNPNENGNGKSNGKSSGNGRGHG